MADLTLEQQQAIAIAQAKAKAAMANDPSQKQTLYTEDTVYNPVSGLPLSSPAYGPETTGGTRIAKNVLENVAAAPISVATGVARSSGAVGIPQLIGKLLSGNQSNLTLSDLVTGNKPKSTNVGDEFVNALGQIERGMEDTGDGYGKYAQKGLNVTGQVAPIIMGGMAGSPLGATSVSDKVMNVAGKIPVLPSYAQNIIGGAAIGGIGGALSPEKPTESLPEYLNEKAKSVGLNAAIGGAVPAAVETAKGLGTLLRKGIGMSTGAGEEAFKQAYKAGKTGDTSFIENMTGKVSMDDVLGMAKQNLSVMKQDKSALYRSGMEDISKDKSILSFNAIDDRLKDMTNVGSYKGQTTNKKAVQALQEIKDSVNKWKNLDPNEYHTPEGMDALKQRVGELLEDLPYGTRARVIADDVYHSIKSTIADQAPTYNKVMKDYSESSDLIREIEKSLSLGNKSSAATAMNKLQSLMRNNVNTNYGYRQEMANKLMQQGGNDLMPALAGQALNSWTPRGLVGQGLDAGALLSLLSGHINPIPTAMTMATTSPRLMGNVVYGAGKIAGKTTPEQQNLARLLTIQGANRMNQGE
jgi:hypothetical protein